MVKTKQVKEIKKEQPKQVKQVKEEQPKQKITLDQLSTRVMVAQEQLKQAQTNYNQLHQIWMQEVQKRQPKE